MSRLPFCLQPQFSKAEVEEMDKTVAKAFKTLETLVACAKPQGITSLSRALGLGKSNVHRLLSTLMSLGYVRSLGDGKYEATLRLWEQGTHVLTRNDAKAVASRYLLGLVKATGETAYLSVLDGFEVVYIDKMDGEHPIRAFSRIGERAPSYAVATGKAFLAFESPELIESISPKLQAHTCRTISCPKRLKAELAKIRDEGVAYNRGEWRDGVCGVAAPIRGSDGRVVMAVGISGPAERLKPRRLRQLAAIVAKAGAAISTELGYAAK